MKWMMLLLVYYFVHCFPFWIIFNFSRPIKMTIYFVSNAVSFEKLFLGIIIQAIEIEKKGDIRLDIGYPVDFIVGTKFGIRRLSGHCDEEEERR